eukprot:ANDGO_02409.mRNA.1 hypothetical protein H257_13025
MSGEASAAAGTIPPDGSAGRTSTLEKLVVELKSQNIVLKNQFESKDREHFDTIKYFQNEISSLRHAVEKITDEKNVLESRIRSQSSAIEVKYTQQIDTLTAMLSHKDSRIQVLEKELSTYQNFKEFKAKLEDDIAKLDASLKEEQMLRRREVAGLEASLHAEAERFEEDLNLERASRNLYIKKKISKLLDDETKVVLNENMELRNELSFLRSQFEKYASAREEAESRCKFLLREIEIHEKTVEEVTRQGYVHLREIKDLKGKVRSLESSLTKTVQEHAEEMKNCRSEHGKREEELHSEISSLRRALDVRKREAVQLRTLGHQILAQRSDLESFFLQALEEVRVSKRKELQDAAGAAASPLGSLFPSPSGRIRRSPRAHASPGRGVSFPSLNGQESFTEDSAAQVPAFRGDASDRKIDIAELSWEEKEKVLRLLFLKMNTTDKKKDRTKGVESDVFPLSESFEDF